jgi:hypothetical protein
VGNKRNNHNWTFLPIDRTYTDLNGDITNADFTGTLNQWAISGTITDGANPLQDVTVSITKDGAPLTPVTTNASGNYAFNNLDAGSTYVIFSTKTHWIFLPIDRTYTDLIGDVNNADFTGTLDQWAINGTITDGANSLQDVTVSITKDGAPLTPVTTDASGNYAFNNLDAGCTYVIFSTKTHWTFLPIDRTYTDLIGDVTNADFTGTFNQWTISGTITDGINPISGVTVTLSGDSSDSKETGIGGYYEFTNLTEGSTYIITPTMENWTFTPENAPFANLNSDVTQDFIGTKNFAENLDNVIVYPNPWKSDIGVDVVTFSNLTENTKIKIYNVAGSFIIELMPDGISYSYNLQNKDVDDIASGVYIFIISNDKGDKKIGKFMVIR